VRLLHNFDSLLVKNLKMGLDITSRQDSLDSQTSTSSSDLGTCNRRTWSISRGAHKCLAILHGEALNVTALALSRGFLYAGSDLGEVRSWGPPDLRESIKFGGGDGAVKCLVVVGNKVISGHQDHKIRVWRRSRSNSQEHRLVTTLSSAQDCISNYLPAKNFSLQGRRHHTSLWINHHDSISSLAVGNGVLYSGSWDKSIKVWRLSDFRCIESLDEHTDAVNALEVDKQNDLLYSGSGDATIKVFQNHQNDEKIQHELLATLEAKSPVNALALSHDGSYLYSGQSDRTVTVWKMAEDKKQWSAVGALRGHRLSILCLKTVGENVVVTGSADKTVRVWKRNADGYHSCVSVMTGHTGPVKSLSVVSDMAMGFLVYSGSMDGDIRVWWLPEDDASDCSSSDSDSPVVVNWRSETAPAAGRRKHFV